MQIGHIKVLREIEKHGKITRSWMNRKLGGWHHVENRVEVQRQGSKTY